MDGIANLAPDLDPAVFGAALDSVRENGYEKTTMELIGASAGVEVAALERHWGGKARLVAEALREHVIGTQSELDTGRLRSDLFECARRMTDLQTGDDELMLLVWEAARLDTELIEAIQDALAHPAAETAHRILDRAAARGEIAADTPAREFIHELLLTVAFSRGSGVGRPIDEGYLRRFVDSVLIPALSARRI